MEVALYVIGISIAIIGAIVYTVYNEVQSVDQYLWQSNNDLKHKINGLQEEIIRLNKRIDDLTKEDDDGSES
jgi:uncharacterized protein YlxW (UPF0749 family)